MRLIKAFTLIELLIVIIIIGVLTVGLMPRITGAQTKARLFRVERDFQDMRTVVYMAQSNTNKSLYEINGRTHAQGTYLGCLYDNPGLWVGDMRNISDASQCMQWYRASLRKIEAAAGMDPGGLRHLERDPRGSPYILSEL